MHTSHERIATQLESVALPDSYDPAALSEWDGRLEVSQCHVVDNQGSVERVDIGEEPTTDYGAPFWTVYCHQSSGGVEALADFPDAALARAFAAGLAAARAI